VTTGDNWWCLTIVPVKCHRSLACIKIEVNIMWLVTLHSHAHPHSSLKIVSQGDFKISLVLVEWLHVNVNVNLYSASSQKAPLMLCMLAPGGMTCHASADVHDHWLGALLEVCVKQTGHTMPVERKQVVYGASQNSVKPLISLHKPHNTHTHTT